MVVGRERDCGVVEGGRGRKNEVGETHYVLRRCTFSTLFSAEAHAHTVPKREPLTRRQERRESDLKETSVAVVAAVDHAQDPGSSMSQHKALINKFGALVVHAPRNFSFLIG
jgi:hypothetical protein